MAKTAAAVAALTPASLAAVRPPHCSDKLLESRHEPLGKYVMPYFVGMLKQMNFVQSTCFKLVPNVVSITIA